jgi:hypothetical protein
MSLLQFLDVELNTFQAIGYRPKWKAGAYKLTTPITNWFEKRGLPLELLYSNRFFIFSRIVRCMHIPLDKVAALKNWLYPGANSIASSRKKFVHVTLYDRKWNL